LQQNKSFGKEKHTMMDGKVKKVLKVILPVIFITYFASITFFTHTHIVNGVTIVHSHPFQKNDAGSPAHEHTGAEIQLIHILSSFFSTGLIVLAIILGLVSSKKVILRPKVFLSHFHDHTQGLSRLRPPPFLYSL